MWGEGQSQAVDGDQTWGASWLETGWRSKGGLGRRISRVSEV